MSSTSLANPRIGVKHSAMLSTQKGLSTFNSTHDLQSLTLSKIYESKRLKEVEEKQLHTRIQFLQNQEFKKLKKIENQRRQA